MRVFLISILIFTTIGLSAQKASSAFLRYGQHDGAILAHEYLKPLGELLGTSLNTGWYNNAGIHKIGGFDITMIATTGLVPSKHEFYDVRSLAQQLEYFSFDESSAMHKAPTIAGKLLPGQEIARLVMNVPQDPAISEPILPNGTDFDMMLLPAIQGTIGLPLNTELMARVMPKIKYDKFGEAFLWGAGIKHSLWDDIPGLNKIPFLRLSVMGAYTKFNSEIKLDNIGYGSNNSGYIDINSDAITGRVLVGAEFPFVAVYGGVGYGKVTSSFDFKENFTTYTFDDDGPHLTTTTDPISLEYPRDGIDFNAGFRVKLMFLTIHADYTYADYQAVTIGVGVTFR